MRNRRAILRRVALGASTVTLAAMVAVLAGGTAAYAAGGLTFSPETGTNQTLITTTTQGFCPAGDTNFDISVSGSGIDVHPIIAANSVLPSAGPVGYTVALSETMATFASEQSVPATLSGPYVFTFNCFLTSTSLSPNGTFPGTLTFTSPTTYTDGATSTSLVASATGSNPYPTVETLTATVAPAGTTGTVQFVDGTTNIGSPVTVSSGGTATLTLDGAAGDPPVPPVGAHSYTATFTPSPASQNGVTLASSTSAAQTLTVTPPAAPAATLGASSTSPYSNQTETLTCTVTPGTAGTVTFYNGTTALNSSPDPVGASPNNVATYAAQFAVGSYSFTCQFTPTPSTLYAPVVSSPVAVTVTTSPNPTATELIQVTVANGSLTITTPNTPVVLGTPVLNATATALVASGHLNNATVTDTRAGDIGYTVTGQLSGDFVGSGHPVPAPAPDAFSGDDLGWTPLTPATSGAGQSATAGPAIAAPLPPLAAGHTNGINLLSVAATLGTSPAGGSYGSIQYGATLTLDIPTNVGADLYQDTITLTAM
ncbi:MAG: Ig-like domain repeat protein [Acidimicrobiales bacterium]